MSLLIALTHSQTPWTYPVFFARSSSSLLAATGWCSLFSFGVCSPLALFKTALLRLVSALNALDNRYLAADAPVDPLPLPREDVLPPVAKTQLPQEQKLKEVEKENTAEGLPKPQEFFDALLSLPDRKKSNGAGRAAQAVSKRFAVSLASVYQARKVLKSGSPGLVEAMRSNSIPVKTAYKKLFAELHGGNEYVQ